MCGRYSLSCSAEHLAAHFGLLEAPVHQARYNIAPTQPVLIIRADAENQRRLAEHVAWGLIPRWADDPQIGSRMINARSETAAEKPAFRGSMRYRRCLVPADGFYEWKAVADGKQPLRIRRADGRLFAFAGLFEHWTGPNGEQIDSCTILTTSPNALIKPIHDRMPVILEPADYAPWLDRDNQDRREVEPLLKPYAAGDLDMVAVSRRVNSPANDEPSLIEPVDPPADSLFD